jgi:hypothetical protein
LASRREAVKIIFPNFTGGKHILGVSNEVPSGLTVDIA